MATVPLHREIEPLRDLVQIPDLDASTLPMREVLTYEISRRLGLGIVPETVPGDGPFGPGSIQRFVDADDAFDALPLVQRGDERLWPIAALDVITNNADRKLGHNHLPVICRRGSVSRGRPMS